MTAPVSVTASAYTVGTPQADGRVWVTETQTLSTGIQQIFSYLSAPDADFQAIAGARSASINAQYALQAEMTAKRAS